MTFYRLAPNCRDMNTVREGLRADELEKDTFDRLICVGCDRPLKMRSDPEELGSVRFCVDCESEWVEMR